jgi:DNA-binding GntR family transcriptional regulator
MSFSVPPVPTLRRSSTADDIVALLRAQIVSGQIAPGTQLREVALAQALGVSRPTLREAFQGLKQEGLVRHEPHRGMFVTSLGPEEIVDIYEVRRVLEGSAGAASTRADDVGLARVQRAFDSLEKAWGKDDAVVIDADLRLHQEIVALLGSPRLDALFDSVMAALRPCLALLSQEMRMTVLHSGSLDEHADIAAAVVGREGRRAQKLLTRHIDENRQLLLSIVGSEEGPETIATGKDDG